jgi:hypothetical protein
MMSKTINKLPDLIFERFNSSGQDIRGENDENID